MTVYVLVAGWIGSLCSVAWNNALDGRWGVLVVNVVLLAALTVVGTVMGHRDVRRGRLVADQERR